MLPRSVRRALHDLSVYVARMICSDAACAAEALAEAQTLEELDALVCGCGCGLAVIGFPDHVEDPLTDVRVVAFARPHPSDLAA